MQVIQVTDAAGSVVDSCWLERAERVHRQLRQNLPSDYAVRLAEVFADGARMVVVADGDTVVCVALWRLVENTYEGRRFYVDDLVSDETRRSQGAGKMMLDWLELHARSLDCAVLALDSGVQRHAAHRFYFREGMHIPSFCFRKALK